MSKRAFLLGNGCSIPYGSPAGGAIFVRGLEIFYQHLLHSPSTNVYYRLGDSLRWMFHFLAHFSKDLVPIYSYPEDVGPAFDRVLKSQSFGDYTYVRRVLEKLPFWRVVPYLETIYRDSSGHGYMNLLHKQTTMADLPGNLFERIGTFTAQSIAASLHDTPDRFYERFAHMIHVCGGDALLILPNYDTRLEQALLNMAPAGLRCAYVLDPGIRIHAPVSLLDAKPNVTLIKPHGSMNAFYCPSCDGVSYLDPSQDCLFWSLPSHGPCNLPNHQGPRPESYPLCVPFATIVPLPQIPSFGIAVRATAYISSLLADADEVIVIGFGFAQLDGSRDFVDEHLFRAIAARPLRIVSTTPSEAFRISSVLRARGAVADHILVDGFNGYLLQNGF